MPKLKDLADKIVKRKRSPTTKRKIEAVKRAMKVRKRAPKRKRR